MNGLSASERRGAARPPVVPGKVLGDNIEVGEPCGLDALEGVADVTHLVVLRAAGADAHEREPVVGCGVERGEHLGAGDGEGIGTLDARP